MAKLFFLLSGENESLPAAEVKAILEAEGYPYANAEEFSTRSLRLEAKLGSVQAVQVELGVHTGFAHWSFSYQTQTETDIAEAAVRNRLQICA